MGLALLALSGAARAADFTLSWEAPAECATPAEIRSQLEGLLGASPEAIIQKDLEVTARIHLVEPGRWQLSLETLRAAKRGTRQLEAPTCDELARAAVVVLALTVDPQGKHLQDVQTARATEARLTVAPTPGTASNGKPATSAPGGPQATAVPAAREPRAPAALAAREPTPTERGSVAEPSASESALARLDGAVGFGQLPRPAPGLRVSGGLLHGDWRAESSMLVLLPRTATVPGQTDKGGRIGLFAGGVRICPRIVRGPFEISLCTGAEVGFLWGRGFGVTEDYLGVGLWATVAEGGVLAYEVNENWALVASGEASVALARPEFRLRNVGVVTRPAVLGGRLGLGLEHRF